VFAALVRLSQRWQVEATGLSHDKSQAYKDSLSRGSDPVRFIVMDNLPMSDLIEIIYPQSMTAKLLQNGEVIAEYKVEQCDSCAKVKKLDPFGYTQGQKGEKLIWLCGDCR
jgi:hypothetical protein